MDRGKKKCLRDKIAEHIDISVTKLSDDEARRLSDFVDDYDSYSGTSKTRERKWKSFSSDGYYWRTETTTDTFMEEEVGIRRETHIRDDDGTELTDIEDIKDGRGILNWLRDHH
ncbi:hypothetical protein [Actinomyces gerencseriae]|jgi:hypothetical protein|uniref:hypothetical protein n=1 Tax=Actinomyces gerencseriae TaxID=52769 RepID=UPI0028ED7E2C|nr:hypothetical protein [Actinomyces gerencseriae]